MLMLDNLVLNTKRNVGLCSAYSNIQFDGPYHDYLGLDNTRSFDAVERMLLGTINTVDGCESIFVGLLGPE